jgi:beta-galactosidase
MKYRFTCYAAAAILATIIASSAVFPATYTVPPTGRTKTDLSGNTWKFITSNTLTGAQTVGYNDASWSTVTIPHTWNTHANKTFYTNCWYRTHFTGAPADTGGGKRFYLFFEGSMAVSDVYLNGTWLGRHNGGYTAFIYDGTATRVDGDNVLAVKVDNDSNPGLPASQNGWMHFGGIHRKVWTLSTNKYVIDPTNYASPGVYVSQKNVSAASAQVIIKTMLRNYDVTGQSYAVNNIICDSSGNIVLTLTDTVSVNANSKDSVVTTGMVPNPVLWGLGNPHFYTVYTELWVNGTLADMVPARIGFRYYQLTTSTFTMNGITSLLRGTDLHSESEYKGNAVDSPTVSSQFDAIQGLGMNYVRLVHYPHPVFTYNIADERGIGVSTEPGDWGSSTNVVSVARDSNVTEMVLQNFNHPCILWWCSANEDSYVADINRWAADIKACDTIKPTSFESDGATTTAVTYIFNHTYTGWYSGTIQAFPSGYHYVTESGAGGVITTHQSYKSLTFTVNSYEPEEYQSLVNEFQFQYIFKTNPTFVPLHSHWLQFDICDTKYKGMNSKGIETYSGFPKDCYYLWLAKAVPSAPMVYINGKHWYLRTAIRDVKVYSNRPSITLYVNGVAKGTKADGAYTHPSGGSVINNVFFFDTVLARGRNIVIASDGGSTADTAVLYYEGAGPSAPPDSSVYITNLASSNIKDSAYFINIPVHAQWPVYYQCDGNADNSFDSIPSILANARWIATKRQSATDSTTNLSFTINPAIGKNATVYIMVTQQTTVPAWITSAGFTNTNVTGWWRDNNLNRVQYQLYSNTYAPGAAVTLGSSAIDFVVLVSTTTTTGIGPHAAATPAASIMKAATFRAFGNRIVIPHAMLSKRMKVTVFDLSGKCVLESITGESTINLHKSGESGTAYIVRIKNID